MPSVSTVVNLISSLRQYQAILIKLLREFKSLLGSCSLKIDLCGRGGSVPDRTDNVLLENQPLTLVRKARKYNTRKQA